MKIEILARLRTRLAIKRNKRIIDFAFAAGAVTTRQINFLQNDEGYIALSRSFVTAMAENDGPAMRDVISRLNVPQATSLLSGFVGLMQENLQSGDNNRTTE